MLIKSLKINNLRNISTADIEPAEGLNFLIGDNGAGKTSVLESLVVLAKGKSFRSGQVGALVGPGQEQFTVVAKIFADHKEKVLGIERGSVRWRARFNGEDVTQLGDLAIHLPLVLLEPNSHQLISGAPEGRRRLLDWGVFHVEHAHLLHWRRYSKAMRQRNAALRLRQREVVQSLDAQMIPLGEAIHAARQAQSEVLFKDTAALMGKLCPEIEPVAMRYYRGWKDESLELALAAVFQRDFERGLTGPGPHRADLVFEVGHAPARERLSRGEQKIVALSLVLAQAELIRRGGQVPLVLLDDLASEFDTAHLHNVLGHAHSAGAQVWITGTDIAPYLEAGAKPARVFHVEQGKITHQATG